MVSKVSKRIEDYIKPVVIRNLSSYSKEFVQIDETSDRETAIKRFVEGGRGIHARNYTSMNFMTIDRMGYSRRVNRTSYEYCREISSYNSENTLIPTLMLSYITDAYTEKTNGYDDGGRCGFNRLSLDHMEENKLISSLEEGRRSYKFYDPTAKYNEFTAVNVFLTEAFFELYNYQPVYIEELDIVINPGNDYENIVHPYQPGSNKLEVVSTEDKVLTAQYFSSVLYIDNDDTARRPIWMIRGTDLIELIPKKRPDLESGFYVYSNNTDSKGRSTISSTFIDFDDFITKDNVFISSLDAERKHKLIMRSMVADEHDIINREIAHKKVVIEADSKEKEARSKTTAGLLKAVGDIIKLATAGITLFVLYKKST